MATCPHCPQSGAADGEQTTTERPFLKKLLPKEYDHLLCFYEEKGNDQFRAHIKLKLTTEDEVFKWLRDFQISSGQTWRKSKTYPNTGRYNAFRVDLRCQYNTFPKTIGQWTKNTSCAATLYLILKRQTHSQNRKSRSGDPHIKDGYLLNVNLRHEHNHRLWNVDTVRKRDVSDQTINRLKKLFDSGHSPSSALDMIQFDLEQEGLGKQEMADRSVCPDDHLCYRLYHKLFDRTYSSPSQEEMLTDIQERLSRYNNDQGITRAKMEKTIDNNVVIAICTPVMERVHTKLRESSEVVFVDKFENGENHVFLLLTDSKAGPLPLGLLITTSDSLSTLTTGLELLQSLFPSDSFFGQECPYAIMTEGCRALRKSLQNVFPQTILLICGFHQLQAMWTWLWSDQNGVAKEDRPQLLNSFRSLVYSDSDPTQTAEYSRCLVDPTAVKYPKFLQHLAQVYEKRGEWAVYIDSNHLSLKRFSTSSCVERATRVFRDNILQRLKACNTPQMVDFVTSRLDAYYIRHLTDAANRTNEPASATPLQGKDEDSQTIIQIDQHHYTVGKVPSELQHFVNVEIGCCSCLIGVTGSSCKHQSSVLNKLGDPENFLHITTLQKKLYREIATGTPVEPLENMIDQWYKTLAEKVRKDPQNFRAPVQNFLMTFNNLNDGSLTAALQCFGQGLQVRSQHLQSSEVMTAQPTATNVRNETTVGRLQVTPSRPTKTSEKENLYQRNPPRRKRPASAMSESEDDSSLAGHL